MYRNEDLKSLIATEGEICLSIYLPLKREGAEVKQNPIRLKHSIQKATELLMEKGLKMHQANDFVRPLRSFLNDEPFWKHPSDGIAFFLTADSFFYLEMPLSFYEEVMVDQRFLIRPLIPLLNDCKFFVLAISENELRFLEGSAYGIQELPVHAVPRNLKDALRFNDPERQLQLHTQTPRIPGGRAAAIFHGHGVGIDDEKDDLQEYCRQIDRGLHEQLREEKAPLVVASVRSLYSTYRKMNTYPFLMEEPLTGNPELLTNSELRKLAWDRVNSQIAGETRGLLRQYQEFSGSNRVTNNVEEILFAAQHGRVQHLLMNTEEPWWGRYLEETGQVETHDQQLPGDTEIANLAVLKCLKTGSKIHEVKPPAKEFAALLAIYRY